MVQYNYQGQVAVITGGAQGIGLAVAQRLLEGNAKVALWDANGQALEDAKAQLKSTDVFAFLVDVTDLSQVEKAAAETENALGAISMLVHSAGIAGAPVADYSPAEWKKVLSINLDGAFNVTKRAAQPSSFLYMT